MSAVVAASLGTVLSGASPLTVFAPFDTAFQAIASVVAALSNTQLATVLQYHVLGTPVPPSAIPFGTPVTTLAAQDITINNAGDLTMTDTTATPANIRATDVNASNGVIHVIDEVLIPVL